jgi:uridine kinase
MVIGIAGGTGSGKTTVVKKVMQLFPKKDVVLLSQDNYY